MGRFVDDIRQARHQGKLPERFSSADVRKACPGWVEGTYSTFLPKHRIGNPGGKIEYFKRHVTGCYSLIDG